MAAALDDTNVLVCLFDGDEPVKRETARAVVGDLAAAGAGCVSTQVLGEFFVVREPEVRGYSVLRCRRQAGRASC